MRGPILLGTYPLLHPPAQSKRAIQGFAFLVFFVIRGSMITRKLILAECRASRTASWLSSRRHRLELSGKERG